MSNTKVSILDSNVESDNLKTQRTLSQVLIIIAFMFVYFRYGSRLVGNSWNMLPVAAALPFFLLLTIKQYKWRISLYTVIAIFCYGIIVEFKRIFRMLETLVKPEELLVIYRTNEESEIQFSLLIICICAFALVLIYRKPIANYYHLKKINVLNKSA